MSNAIRIIILMMALMQGELFYPAALTVTGVSAGVVTLEDRRGHQYEIEEAEAWRAGDKASAIMFSNGTYDRKDDTILAIQYEGKGGEE